MALEGSEPRELVRLHGELLAHGWVEQNTGASLAQRPGTVPACYRVTAAGVRALRLASDGGAEGDEQLAEAGRASLPQSPRERTSRPFLARSQRATH